MDVEGDMNCQLIMRQFWVIDCYVLIILMIQNMTHNHKSIQVFKTLNITPETAPKVLIKSITNINMFHTPNKIVWPHTGQYLTTSRGKSNNRCTVRGQRLMEKVALLVS